MTNVVCCVSCMTGNEPQNSSRYDIGFTSIDKYDTKIYFMQNNALFKVYRRQLHVYQDIHVVSVKTVA